MPMNLPPVVTATIAAPRFRRTTSLVLGFLVILGAMLALTGVLPFGQFF